MELFQCSLNVGQRVIVANSPLINFTIVLDHLLLSFFSLVDQEHRGGDIRGPLIDSLKGLLFLDPIPQDLSFLVAYQIHLAINSLRCIQVEFDCHVLGPCQGKSLGSLLREDLSVLSVFGWYCFQSELSFMVELMGPLLRDTCLLDVDSFIWLWVSHLFKGF